MTIPFKKSVALISLAVMMSSAYGYEINSCPWNSGFWDPEEKSWPNPNITFEPYRVSFPVGSAYEQALENAVEAWNKNPSPARLSLSYSNAAFDTSDNNGTWNGRNEIWATSASLSGAAVEFSYFSGLFGLGCEFRESDIIVSNGENWTSSRSRTQLDAYGGSFRPLEATMIHEFGHSFGLQHVSDQYSVMGESRRSLITNGSTSRPQVGSDSAAGVVDLYGFNSSNIQDLAVSHWTRTGESNGYAVHGRTGVYDIFGALLPSTMINGEPHYFVNAGQTVFAMYTFENNGQSSLEVDVATRFSTNNYISPADPIIGSASFEMHPGMDNIANGFSASSYKNAILTTIPSNLTSGRSYWIGVVVDDSGSHSEIDESNNRTYTGIIIN